MPKYSSFWARATAACGLTAALLFAPEHGVAKTPGLPYLNEVIDPTVHASGGVAAVPSDGIAALGSNPAQLNDASDDGWRFLSVRVPETRARILSFDATQELVEGYRLSREGSSLVSVRRAVRLSSSTQLAADAAFRASGPWSRVDQEGTAVNTFPRTDWLVGVSLARRFGRRLSAGVTTKWLRTKYADIDEPAQFGHGWAFDVGLHYRLRAWRIGLTARNLSNGLSSVDLTRPRDPRHEVALGVARTMSLSPDVSLDLAGDLRFPSRRGVQTASGATLTYRDDAALSIGYRRSVERWRAGRVDLDQDATTFDDRLWVAQGRTLGGWVRVGGWAISFAASPLFLPRIDDTERRIVETDRWLWTLGVGRGR